MVTKQFQEFLLASFLKDADNFKQYKIDEDNICYKNNKKLGKIEIKIEEDKLTLLFQPETCVKYVDITLNKS